MQISLLPIIGASITVIGTTATAYNRYRRSIGPQVETFRAYVWGGIRYAVGRRIWPRMAARFSLRNYARHELAHPTKLVVPGINETRLNLDSMFVPLALHYATARTMTHEHLLSGSFPRCALIGDPGSGKTSIVKRMYRDACKNALRYPNSARLPVSIELRRLTPPDTTDIDALGDWAMAMVRDKVIEVEGYQMEVLFDTYKRGPGLLLLLDGLDEVPTPSYERIEVALSALSEQLEGFSPRNVIIITLRSQLYVYVRDQLSSMNFEPVTIQPLEPHDIYTFLNKWSDATEAELNVPRLFRLLTEQPTLKSMCSNPLVLAMYIAHDQQTRTAALVETRTQFYRLVLDELVIIRRSRARGMTVGRTSLKRQREEVLGTIALTHMLDGDQPANSIPFCDAIRAIQRAVGYDDAAAAERYLAELSRDTGLFTVERDRESMRFIHLTFCEYFAALQCVEADSASWPLLTQLQPADLRTGSQLLTGGGRAFDAESTDYNRYAEIVVFACALSSRERRFAYISDVGAAFDRDVLIRCLIESQEYDHPEVRSMIQSEIDVLSKAPVTAWYDEWFRRVRSVMILLRDSTRILGPVATQTSGTIHDAWRTLVGDDRQRMQKLFELYVRQDPEAALDVVTKFGIDVRKELARTLVISCDEPELLEIAVEHLGEGRDLEIWVPVLAEAGLTYPSVATALNDRGRLPSLVEEAPHRTERRIRWDRAWACKGRLYGWVLTMALSSLIASAKSLDDGVTFPRLYGLLRISPRKRRWSDSLGAFNVLALTMSFAGLATFVSAVVLQWASDWLLVAMLVLGSLLIVNAVIAIAVRGYIYSVTAALLNLRPCDERKLAEARVYSHAMRGYLDAESIAVESYRGEVALLGRREFERELFKPFAHGRYERMITGAANDKYYLEMALREAGLA